MNEIETSIIARKEGKQKKHTCHHKRIDKSGRSSGGFQPDSQASAVQSLWT